MRKTCRLGIAGVRASVRPLGLFLLAAGLWIAIFVVSGPASAQDRGAPLEARDRGPGH